MALQEIMTKKGLCVVANAYLPYKSACYVVATVISGINSDSIICYNETILIFQLKYRITCIFSSFKSFDTIIDRLIWIENLLHCNIGNVHNAWITVFKKINNNIRLLAL